MWENTNFFTQNENEYAVIKKLTFWKPIACL